MSARVATTFKEHFGKPKISDCLNSTLTFQKFNKGSSVYGLVTKQQYFHKPTEDSYNNAFQKLVEDFKLRNFDCLVCPTMGCICDGVSHDAFAKNLVYFQIATGVTVNIIINSRATSHKLKMGTHYDELIKHLKDRIDKLCSTDDSYIY